MENFIIHTEEIVHGVYNVRAEDKDAARAMAEAGELPQPSVFETISMEIENIEREDVNNG